MAQPRKLQAFLEALQSPESEVLKAALPQARSLARKSEAVSLEIAKALRRCSRSHRRDRPIFRKCLFQLTRVSEISRSARTLTAAYFCKLLSRAKDEKAREYTASVLLALEEYEDNHALFDALYFPSFAWFAKRDTIPLFPKRFLLRLQNMAQWDAKKARRLLPLLLARFGESKEAEERLPFGMNWCKKSIRSLVEADPSVIEIFLEFLDAPQKSFAFSNGLRYIGCAIQAKLEYAPQAVPRLTEHTERLTYEKFVRFAAASLADIAAGYLAKGDDLSREQAREIKDSLVRICVLRSGTSYGRMIRRIQKTINV